MSLRGQRTLRSNRAGLLCNELGPLDLDEGERMALRFELRVQSASRTGRVSSPRKSVYNAGDGKTTIFLP
jgi:hypothetical protein